MDTSDTLISIVGILAIFVVPFAAIAWVLVTLINSRNKTQATMASQGIVPMVKKPAPNKYTTLRNGCLFIGLAIGLIVGVFINLNTFLIESMSFLVVCSSSTFFLGIGYIVFYVLVRNKNLDDE